MASIPKANLYFSISGGAIWGSAGGQCFHMRAFSGGRGGSTKTGVVDEWVVNNPLKTNLKTDHEKGDHEKGIHGGPLPVNDYRISMPSNHLKLGLSARLTPIGKGSMFKRSGFYFHGRGKHGSDGCIVLEDHVSFKALMKALKASQGGTLHVLYFDSAVTI